MSPHTHDIVASILGFAALVAVAALFIYKAHR